MGVLHTGLSPRPLWSRRSFLCCICHVSCLGPQPHETRTTRLDAHQGLGFRESSTLSSPIPLGLQDYFALFSGSAYHSVCQSYFPQPPSEKVAPWSEALREVPEPSLRPVFVRTTALGLSGHKFSNAHSPGFQKQRSTFAFLSGLKSQNTLFPALLVISDTALQYLTAFPAEAGKQLTSALHGHALFWSHIYFVN